MNRRHALAALAAAPLLLTIAVTHAQEATKPQPKLPTEPLAIVTHDGRTLTFQVEMAETESQQMTGLMFRPEVPDGTGMLFDWGSPRRSQMWMKNTIAPLDMLFIGPDGRIRHIAEHTVPQSLAVIDGGDGVLATLEIAAGTAERLDIRVGDLVKARLFHTA
jgi:uncharacterized membrane protein (UPF0127 family)